MYENELFWWCRFERELSSHVKRRTARAENNLTIQFSRFWTTFSFLPIQIWSLLLYFSFCYRNNIKFQYVI